MGCGLIGRIVEEQLDHAGATDLIEALKSAGGEPALLAGALRDVMISVERGSGLISPRDFDIGVSGLAVSTFAAILDASGGKRNRYGGYVVRTKTTTLDIWRLEDTCGLRITGRSRTLENVLRSFILAPNAIAIDLKTWRLTDLGCRHAIRMGVVLPLQTAIVHNEATFSAKAFVLHRRLNLPLSDDLLDFAVRHHRIAALVHEARKAGLDYGVAGSRHAASTAIVRRVVRASPEA